MYIGLRVLNLREADPRDRQKSGAKDPAGHPRPERAEITSNVGAGGILKS
jgi:hypothetical protein